ncbi:hypothetical protein J3E68DRAFT_405623 [Trichoderma sp. SZMC 28012]
MIYQMCLRVRWYVWWCICLCLSPCRGQVCLGNRLRCVRDRSFCVLPQLRTRTNMTIWEHQLGLRMAVISSSCFDCRRALCIDCIINWMLARNACWFAVSA